MPIYNLPQEFIFPDPSEAEEDGLLAIGGDLSTRRIITAYAMGIFPWYNEDSPILWWSPDPRLVLYPDDFKLSKSLRQRINRGMFRLRIDFAFEEVIFACANTFRKNQEGTWINRDMQEAYIQLFKMGLAHSIEIWEGNKLIGGLYGVSLGAAFFGESMFHKRSDASKMAFFYLSKVCKVLNFDFIDCQVSNDHLLSLGAKEIERDCFLNELSFALEKPTLRGNWEKMIEIDALIRS